MAIYLKFKGILAKGFDSLHAIGLTMSHKWTSDAVERISNHCMKEVRERLDKNAWTISYDNVQIPFHIFSQHLDNKDQFGNGTAATVYVKQDGKPLSDDVNLQLRRKRQQGLKNPLTKLEIIQLALNSHTHIQEQTEYIVLRMLLESPDFNFKTYSGNESQILKAPPAMDPLPCGQDHITLQYLLGTVDILEASYEDNSRLISEWFRQLGWDSLTEQKKIATSRVVAFIGDQLTMDRLRGLFKFRAEDENSFERLDFSVLAFGWLHLQMAFATSLHKQYGGTTHGQGLQQAFMLLKKKGLTKVLTKGPFHHDLNETLNHVAEAHFQEEWLQVGEVENLSDLRDQPPDQLKRLASQIVQKWASTEGLNDIDSLPEQQPDYEHRQVTMWNQDVLQYLVLNDAVRDGDVGLMELLLPHMFIRFNGAGKGKYAIEVLELLQGLHKEWPDEIW